MKEIELIFNNRNMADLFLVRDIRGRGIVNYEVQDTEKTQADGSYYRYKKRPPRVLEVDVTIYGNSPEDLRENIDRLNGIFKTTNELPIIFTDEPDRIYYGTPSSASQDEEIVSISNETISFYCSDPDKIGEEKHEISNRINVECSSEVKPFITAVVTESSDYVEFVHNGEDTFRLHYDFNVNDTVKIDCEKEKVYINDALQMVTIDLLYADFFQLIPGYNEIATYPDMNLDIKYEERWL